VEDENREKPKPRKRGKRKKEDKGAFFPVGDLKSNLKNMEFPKIEIPHEMFERVRVVLVEVKYPGNIGQVARVLRNFGYGKLALVKPRCMIDAESEKMAVGAESLLDAIRIYDTIEEAVKGARIVIGSTRRRGVERKNILDPRLSAELIEPVLAVGEAALLFGPEDRGLTNEDLAQCHWIASIPSGSDRPSFNLSHAVAMFLYEITYKLLLPLPRNYALHEKYEGMFNHLEKFLDDIGFLHENDPARMMLVIRQMLYRARFSEREVRIIRGIVNQAYWRIANPDKDVKKDTGDEAGGPAEE